ncbi:MAG: CocE/NonD family hydrolase, partial [Stenotrophobium sp.]
MLIPLKALDIRLPLVAVMATAMLLAGCGSSTVPAPESGASSASGGSAWTTLGTRALTNQPGTSITSNAGDKWAAYNPPALYPNTVAQNLQYITMPDGTQLAVYVKLPADSSGKAIPGTFPTVLNQTAYNNSVGENADSFIIEHGYVSVVVDVRGTGQSTGSWEAFGAAEQSDYGHVVDWVTKQPWFNGAIGLYGGSYDAIATILTAAQNHPAVKAAMPVGTIGDGYRDVVFTGGQVNPTFVPLWLGVVSVSGIADPTVLTNPSVGIPAVVDHILSAITNFQVPTILKGVTGDPSIAYDDPKPGSFWGIRSPLESDGKITVPTFIIGGLHDIFQRGEPMSYEEIKTHAPAKILLGPWEHFTSGAGLPVDGVPVFDHIELQWFDQYVKGMNVGADKLPNVTQYVYGYGHYVTSTDWPNPQAQAQKLYLRGDQSLTATEPTTDEASNTVAQVPINGLCSISTTQWTAGALGVLPLPCFTDDSVTELTDVKYQTAPLIQNMYINGPIEADVWMSTTASDAGLSVRVDDVDG